MNKYGRRCSALNPDTCFWAHATFIEDIVTGHELTGLSAADKKPSTWNPLIGIALMPPPASKHLSERANAVVGPLILKPLVQTPLVTVLRTRQLQHAHNVRADPARQRHPAL